MQDQLFQAITGDDAPRVKALLDEDPDLAAARDEAGRTPLMLAAYMDRAEILGLVFSYRAEPDFFEACIIGDERTVRRSLEGGQSPDGFAPDGFTPLGLAVFFGQGAVAEVLMDAGADPNLQARNDQGVGPIHAAVARGNIDMLGELLLLGADPDAPQQMLVRPIHGAAASGRLPAVALLLMFGADPGAETEDGSTAAELARQNGHDALARRLEEIAQVVE